MNDHAFYNEFIALHIHSQLTGDDGGGNQNGDGGDTPRHRHESRRHIQRTRQRADSSSRLRLRRAVRTIRGEERACAPPLIRRVCVRDEPARRLLATDVAIISYRERCQREMLAAWSSESSLAGGRAAQLRAAVRAAAGAAETRAASRHVHTLLRVLAELAGWRPLPRTQILTHWRPGSAGGIVDAVHAFPGVLRTPIDDCRRPRRRDSVNN